MKKQEIVGIQKSNKDNVLNYGKGLLRKMVLQQFSIYLKILNYLKNNINIFENLNIFDYISINTRS
jgi:hypothetical protein